MKSKKWNLFTSNEIKPSGWLRRQLELQADGLCGNLDLIWPDIRDSAWIGGTAEGWERVPYWLDGFVPLAYLLEDEDKIARAKKYIDAIVAYQNEDGWICPCDRDKIDKYDNWAVLLITKVLTVYYECSNDERIPSVIYRTMKNYYELLSSGDIKLFQWGRARWFEGFIALNFLYERNPEPWMKELAHILKNNGTDYNTLTERWKVPLNEWTLETHIVNMAMMLKYEAVSCDLLGEEYKDMAESLYSVLNQYNGTAVGIFTGDECLSGISPIQGTELCSVVELMYSYELLYAYTGDTKWAERLEKISFNALPATIDDKMQAHQYVQQSNQIECVTFGGNPVFRTVGKDANVFGLEPHFGCCTANFGQGWPKLALSAFMYSKGRVLSALPVPSTLKTDKLEIILETNYPFENTFTYRVNTKERFELVIRIPSFAKEPTINGKRADLGDNFLCFTAGEQGTVTVSYDVSAKFVQSPVGLTYVQCGSLVYSVPIDYTVKSHEYRKNGVERKLPYCDYDYLCAGEWKYGYSCNEKELCVRYHGIGDIPFSSKTPPITVQARVREINWSLEDGYRNVCAKLPDLPLVTASEEKNIELYPYGCAKLRITEAPKL